MEPFSTRVPPPSCQIPTPDDIAQWMVRWLDLPMGQVCRVLEPSCGRGALLEALLDPGMPAGLEVTGIELDPEKLEQARGRLGKDRRLTLVAGDALAMGAALVGRFDRVIANPPWLSWSQLSSDFRQAHASRPFLGCPLVGRPGHADAQPDLSLYFVVLAVEALREGGRAVLLLPREWLDARRAGPLRKWLNERCRLEQVVELPSWLEIFRQETGGVAAQAVLMVLTRTRPGLAHRVAVVKPEVGTAQDAWRRALVGGQLPPGRWVAQDAVLRGSRERAHIQEDGCDWLGNHLWFRVMGGHQPPVAWLDWLELTAEDVAQLPAREQAWLKGRGPGQAQEGKTWLLPALREARDILPPRTPSPRTYWLVSRDALSALEPHIPETLQRVKQRLEATGRVMPETWWQLPHVRNMAWVTRAGPRLLAPRTATCLTVVWDAYGHSVKGTNSLVVSVDQDAALRGLFAWLSSRALREWTGRHGVSYHGVGIKQEPAMLEMLPVPRAVQGDVWQRLNAAGQAWIEGGLEEAGLDELVDGVVERLGGLPDLT